MQQSTEQYHNLTPQQLSHSNMLLPLQTPLKGHLQVHTDYCPFPQIYIGQAREERVRMHNAIQYKMQDVRMREKISSRRHHSHECHNKFTVAASHHCPKTKMGKTAEKRKEDTNWLPFLCGSLKLLPQFVQIVTFS